MQGALSPLLQPLVGTGYTWSHAIRSKGILAGAYVCEGGRAGWRGCQPLISCDLLLWLPRKLKEVRRCFPDVWETAPLGALG